jgi:hypothetical protein
VIVIPSDLRDSLEITMPWTEITRPHYVREGVRYASDLRLPPHARSASNIQFPISLDVLRACWHQRNTAAPDRQHRGAAEKERLAAELMQA